MVLPLSDAYSQGCSDAGFCTMGAMRPNQPVLNTRAFRFVSAELNYGQGGTKFHDLIKNITMDLNCQIRKNWAVQLKLPYVLVDGPLAKTSGMGDVSLSFSRKIVVRETRQLAVTVGTKIPSGVPDKRSADGRPLPMYYQTTLGTYDLIAGLSFQTAKWMMAGAVQVPLNTADNNFKWGAWKDSPQEAIARTYPVADDIRRGADWMLRVERNFRSSKWNGYLGLLSIYRFVPDRIKLPATGERTYVTGSNGLVLNAVGGVGYMITARQGLKFLGAFAPIKRKINPDGLSRLWVLSVGYEYRF